MWWSLIKGCEKVERLAQERRADVKEALLDWFGVGVKAQDISSFVKRMDLLAQRVRPPASLCIVSKFLVIFDISQRRPSVRQRPLLMPVWQTDNLKVDYQDEIPTPGYLQHDELLAGLCSDVSEESQPLPPHLQSAV